MIGFEDRVVPHRRARIVSRRRKEGGWEDDGGTQTRAFAYQHSLYPLVDAIVFLVSRGDKPDATAGDIVEADAEAAEFVALMPTPENALCLFDLIVPKEERFKAAFYEATGNTLVARDMEQANRLAFWGGARWRVVTTVGQVIDASGTMSGGGVRAQSGGTRVGRICKRR